jgi:hypothetical protein
MEKLKLYSIKNNLLSERFTNWEILLLETNKMLEDYLIEASKWHNYEYIKDDIPFDLLPSDCYSEILFKVISLWFPFYYDLFRGFQEEIESDFSKMLFNIKPCK